MNAKVTRATTATAALLMAGALAACSDDSAGSEAPPPAGEDTAPAPTEQETREAPSDDLGGGAEAPSGGQDDEAGSGGPGDGDAPMDDDGAPPEGRAPMDDDGAPSEGEDVNAEPADNADPGAIAHDDWLRVPMPEDWTYTPEGGWVGSDGAAIDAYPCYPPDEGPLLGYSECVQYVPAAGQPSASDPDTEVDIQQLTEVGEGLNATEVSVSDGQTEVVYWIVENQETEETAVVEYTNEGVDEAVLESVRQMTLR